MTSHEHVAGGAILPPAQITKLLQQLTQSLTTSLIPHTLKNGTLPPSAHLHNLSAPIPHLIISPTTELELISTLKILHTQKIYSLLPVSVKSGGHSYANTSSCSGIMINLLGMNQLKLSPVTTNTTETLSSRTRTDTPSLSIHATQPANTQTLTVQPGVLLAHVIHLLSQAKKAVSHGDCFSVGSGGHFITAGWDAILSRKHGLGCQNVVGGRIILYDGSAIDVSENSTSTGTQEKDLLAAMRGGAVGGVGVVSEIRLRVIEEPEVVRWIGRRISREELGMCCREKMWERVAALPDEISMSWRVDFEQDGPRKGELVCSINIASLLEVEETISRVSEILGGEVAALFADTSTWSSGSLLDFRMLPASEFLDGNRHLLGKLTSSELSQHPEKYWKTLYSQREMARSYLDTVSHWIIPGCDSMLLTLYAAFAEAEKDPRACKRMFANVIQGGGAMTRFNSQKEAERGGKWGWKMPLGDTLARFEIHWGNQNDEAWCRDFTERISGIIKEKEDLKPGQPYRGDIWLEEQLRNPELDGMLAGWDRRCG